MAINPKKKLGIQTYNNEFTPATAPNTSEIFIRKTYKNIIATPIAKLIPVPPLFFLKESATAIIVRI